MTQSKAGTHVASVKDHSPRALSVLPLTESGTFGRFPATEASYRAGLLHFPTRETNLGLCLVRRRSARGISFQDNCYSVINLVHCKQDRRKRSPSRLFFSLITIVKYTNTKNIIKFNKLLQSDQYNSSALLKPLCACFIYYALCLPQTESRF